VVPKGRDRFAILDSDGLAAPGEFIKPGDVYLNIQRPTNTRDPPPGGHLHLPDSFYRWGARGEGGGQLPGGFHRCTAPCCSPLLQATPTS
jgi:DNA-directed RNA polymerase III subunit RPC2